MLWVRYSSHKGALHEQDDRILRRMRVVAVLAAFQLPTLPQRALMLAARAEQKTGKGGMLCRFHCSLAC